MHSVDITRIGIHKGLDLGVGNDSVLSRKKRIILFQLLTAQREHGGIVHVGRKKRYEKGEERQEAHVLVAIYLSYNSASLTDAQLLVLVEQIVVDIEDLAS